MKGIMTQQDKAAVSDNIRRYTARVGSCRRNMGSGRLHWDLCISLFIALTSLVSLGIKATLIVFYPSLIPVPITRMLPAYRATITV